MFGLGPGSIPVLSVATGTARDALSRSIPADSSRHRATTLADRGTVRRNRRVVADCYGQNSRIPRSEDVAELAASQHGAFTRSQAAALKFDRARAADRSLVDGSPSLTQASSSSPEPRAVGTSSSRRQRWLSAGMPSPHIDRLRACHGLDGFDDIDVVEVSVTREHRWRCRGGAIAHHVQTMDGCDVVDLAGIPCSGLARTLTDIGSVCPQPLVVRRALTDARRRGTSLRWIQLTAQRLHRPGQTRFGLTALATRPDSVRRRRAAVLARGATRSVPHGSGVGASRSAVPDPAGRRHDRRQGRHRPPRCQARPRGPQPPVSLRARRRTPRRTA